MKKIVILTLFVLSSAVANSQSSGIFILKQLNSMERVDEVSKSFVPYEIKIDTSWNFIGQKDKKQLEQQPVDLSAFKNKDTTSIRRQLDSLNRIIDFTKIEKIETRYKILKSKTDSINKQSAFFETDTTDKLAFGVDEAKDYRVILAEQHKKELSLINNLTDSVQTLVNIAKVLYNLNQHPYDTIRTVIKSRLEDAEEKLNAASKYGESIEKRITDFGNKIKKRIDEKKKKDEENQQKQLTSMPNVTIPLSSAQVIPSLNIMGSRTVKNEKTASSHSFLLYVAKDFSLKTDSTPSAEIYQKATTNLFIPEASNLGFQYKYAKAFFFNESKEENFGVLDLQFNFLSKLIPVKTIVDSAVKYSVVKNNFFIHIKAGGELFIIKKVFNLYANFNGLVAINDVKTYEELYGLGSNKLVTFLDIGAHVSLINDTEKKDFAIELGLIIQNPKIKSYTLNEDIAIPTFKLAYTFDSLK